MYFNVKPVPRGAVHDSPDGGAGHEDGEAADQAVDPDQLEAGVTLIVDIVMVCTKPEKCNE